MVIVCEENPSCNECSKRNYTVRYDFGCFFVLLSEEFYLLCKLLLVVYLFPETGFAMRTRKGVKMFVNIVIMATSWNGQYSIEYREKDIPYSGVFGSVGLAEFLYRLHPGRSSESLDSLFE